MFQLTYKQTPTRKEEKVHNIFEATGVFLPLSLMLEEQAAQKGKPRMLAVLQKFFHAVHTYSSVSSLPAHKMSQ